MPCWLLLQSSLIMIRAVVCAMRCIAVLAPSCCAARVCTKSWTWHFCLGQYAPHHVHMLTHPNAHQHRYEAVKSGHDKLISIFRRAKAPLGVDHSVAASAMCQVRG